MPFAATAVCHDAGKIDINSHDGDVQGAGEMGRGMKKETTLSFKTSRKVRDGMTMKRDEEKDYDRSTTFCIFPYEYVIRMSLDGFCRRRSRADKFTVNICPLPRDPGLR